MTYQKPQNHKKILLTNKSSECQHDADKYHLFMFLVVF